jgi:hypothetical protein
LHGQSATVSQASVSFSYLHAAMLRGLTWQGNDEMKRRAKQLRVLDFRPGRHTDASEGIKRGRAPQGSSSLRLALRFESGLRFVQPAGVLELIRLEVVKLLEEIRRSLIVLALPGDA